MPFAYRVEAGTSPARHVGLFGTLRRAVERMIAEKLRPEECRIYALLDGGAEVEVSADAYSTGEALRGVPAAAPEEDQTYAAPVQPAISYLAGLAPSSRRPAARALEIIARIRTDGRADASALDWGAWKREHTRAVAAALAERYAPTSVRKKMLGALRGVLKEACRLGQMDPAAYRRAADLGLARPTRLPRRIVTAGELRAIVAACAADPTAAGARDGALLALLCGIGLRPVELVALELRDYDQRTGKLSVPAHPTPRPRRPAVLVGLAANRDPWERTWIATNDVRAALAVWLRTRGAVSGPLFVPVPKGGRIVVQRLARTKVVRHILNKRALEAKVPRCSPGDLRRSFFLAAEHRSERGTLPTSGDHPVEKVVHNGHDFLPVPYLDENDQLETRAVPELSSAETSLETSSQVQ